MHDLIFYSNRRTPEVVPRGGKSKLSGTKAGRIVKRRQATESEEKTIRNGGWVRVNAQGHTPSNPNYISESKSKIRPHYN